jgi:hypothetical protein
MESLLIDQIRSTLDKMTVRDLHTVASEMGVRATERSPREALVHQVSTKITNARGYRSLGDGNKLILTY